MESIDVTNKEKIYYKVAAFNELTQQEVYEMCKVRYEVFVCEQEITCENDFDDKDQDCLHLFAMVSNDENHTNTKVAGYCRLLPKGMSYQDASIGRVLVLKEFRGMGIAQEMMRVAISHIKQYYGENNITLSAQSYIKNLYLSVGFEQISDEYDEAKIPHVKMRYKGV